MSWTLVHSDPTAGTLAGMIAFNGIVYANASHTRRWDGAASDVILFTNHPFPSAFGSGDMAIASGTLYGAELTNGGTQSAIYRYNGVPDNWTLVDDPGVGVNPNVLAGIRLNYAGTTLLHNCGVIGTSKVRRSADGTTWFDDTLTGLSRTRNRHVAVTASGEFALVRKTSDNHDYMAMRSGTSWTITGVDMTAANYTLYNHVGDFHHALFAIRGSDNKVLYSEDGGATWTATSITHVGGGNIFGWGVGGGFTFLTTNSKLYQWNAVANDFTQIDTLPAGKVFLAGGLVLWNGLLYVGANDDIYVNDSFVYTTNDLSASIAPVAMDVSADDYYLYVAALTNSSQPLLLRLFADLTTDPAVVYNPAAGDTIGVRCGDLNENWVWIAGDFGTPLVRLSEDDGATWITKDPGTWVGVVTSFVVGPDDDNLVLAVTDGDDDLHETEDGGLNWDTLNAAMPFDVSAMDRLYFNLDEIVFGVDAAGADRVRYTPNNGTDLEDITAGTPNFKVNDLIVG